MGNHLHYGNNLTVLREQIRDAFVDLICLDPPFNSTASCIMLFKGPTGTALLQQRPATVPRPGGPSGERPAGAVAGMCQVP